jgi:oligopeptide/dipeptide ABC transporter ATP-binding protein
VVAETCDSVAVMYAGRIVERTTAAALFARPRHPYTAGLLASIPRLDTPPGHLPTIAGTVPPPGSRPKGCAFAERCTRRLERCIGEVPPLAGDRAHQAACWNPVP